jgi:hypothetical protein
MNSKTQGLRVASVLFGLVCLGHLWRWFAHVDVRLDSHAIPMWLSVAAAVVAGGLSLWMWRLSSARI